MEIITVVQRSHQQTAGWRLFLYIYKELGQKCKRRETLRGLHAFIFRQQNAGQNSSIKVGNKFSVNMAKFIIFGKRVINQNSIQEESWRH